MDVLDPPVGAVIEVSWTGLDPTNFSSAPGVFYNGQTIANGVDLEQPGVLSVEIDSSVFVAGANVEILTRNGRNVF
ncbi:MAG: hypothetical protein AAFW88_12160, partial [Pseudomonadota bacterium]